MTHKIERPQVDTDTLLRHALEVGRKGLALAGVVVFAGGSAASIASAKSGGETLRNTIHAPDKAKPIPHEWFALSKSVIESEKKSTKPNLFYGAIEMDGYVTGASDHSVIYLNLPNKPGEGPLEEVHPGRIVISDFLKTDVNGRTYAIVYDRGPIYSELYYKDDNSSKMSADTSWPNLVTFRFIDLTKAKKYGHLRYLSHSDVEPQMAHTFVGGNQFGIKDDLPPWGVPLEYAYQGGTPHPIKEYVTNNSLKYLPVSYKPPFKIKGG